MSNTILLERVRENFIVNFTASQSQKQHASITLILNKLLGTYPTWKQLTLISVTDIDRILRTVHRKRTIICMVSVTAHIPDNSVTALEGVLVRLVNYGQHVHLILPYATFIYGVILRIKS
jgi:hypothetical protein